jgi:hypothetical protein
MAYSSNESAMDLARVLAELREELDNVNAAIRSLERLQARGKRRGRLPAWLAGGKPSGSDPARKRSGQRDPDTREQE